MHYEVYSKDMLSSTTRAFGSPLRYVQGQGEFGRLPLYTAPYGNACVIIDGFLYQDLNARLEKAYAESDAKFVSISFNGECCEEEVERIGRIARGKRRGRDSRCRRRQNDGHGENLRRRDGGCPSS